MFKPRKCRVVAKLLINYFCIKIYFIKYICNNVAKKRGGVIPYQFPGGSALPPLPPHAPADPPCSCSPAIATFLQNY